MKKIVYTRPDGGVSIINPAYNDPIGGQREGEPENAFIDRVASRAVPANATNVVVVDALAVPERLFRNAFRQSGANAPHVDMPLARGIKTDQIREQRDVRLAAEDIAYMRADENGNPSEKVRIAALKQSLRDLPADVQPALDALDNPAALDAFEPTWPVWPATKS
jgi:hypothetical protein